MKKIVYKSKAIQAVILIVAATLLVSLWPLRIFHETVTTSIPPVNCTMSDTIDEEHTLLQTIVAQYDHMDSIGIYLGENSVGDSFYVRILNEKQQQICEEEVIIDKDCLPGYQKAMIDVDMEVNKMYYVILQGRDSAISVGVETVPLTDMPYLGVMYYSDSTVDGASLVADYCYGVPLRKTKVLLYGFAILAAAALLLFAVQLVYKKKEDKLITVERAVKVTLNPLAAVLTIACLAAALTGVCGSYLLDNTVYVISVLLFSGLLFYGINHNREGQESVLTAEYLKSHAGDIFQSVCLAGAIAACCEYMSGLYDIHHAVAERKEMIWFALAIVAMFKWKEIVNVINLIYLTGAGIYGFHYYQSHLTQEMDDLNRQVLKYTVWIGILLGLILIRTLIGFCRRKPDRPAYLYTALLALFFALIIVFRNGRWWTVAMAVSFTLFYLNYGMWEHKERLLVNIVRGVVLQFLLATGYCLLHRPYVTFRNARYTHIFHTVTITASYLTMVECVAVIMLLAKLTKSRKWKDIWKEAVFFGVVSSYMIFTMARTAYLAVFVTAFFALLIMTAGKGRERLINLCKNAGLMILTALVILPVTFTLQRNVPALVSEPYLYEIEYSMYCPDDVMRGRKLDSKNFMRVGRFIDVFGEKILGIPEGTFDIYGEQEEYRRTHNIALIQKEETAKEAELIASLHYKPKASFTEEEPEADFTEEDSQKEDYTNGRIDIFRSYMEQLTMTGHEGMGALLKNGEIATHAHNIYLQAAYDHGIFAGIVFAVWIFATFVYSCLYYYKKKEIIVYAALPAVITAAVAVAGMVEWIFHLSNPCGFLLMLAITPLLMKREK